MWNATEVKRVVQGDELFLGPIQSAIADGEMKGLSLLGKFNGELAEQYFAGFEFWYVGHSVSRAQLEARFKKGAVGRPKIWRGWDIWDSWG